MCEREIPFHIAVVSKEEGREPEYAAKAEWPLRQCNFMQSVRIIGQVLQAQINSRFGMNCGADCISITAPFSLSLGLICVFFVLFKPDP